MLRSWFLGRVDRLPNEVSSMRGQFIIIYLEYFNSGLGRFIQRFLATFADYLCTYQPFRQPRHLLCNG